MNKKILVGITLVVLIAIVGYFIHNRYFPNGLTNAPKETKIPEEEIKVGNEDTKLNKDAKKSLVVYFSVPETIDPNKKMTTEEENSAIVVDGEVH